MRVDTNGLSPAQFRTSLPVIQSKPSPNSSSGNMALLQPIQSLYGGCQEIKKEDSLMYRYRQENGTSIMGEGAPYKRVDNASDVPQEFIDRLNSEAVTEWNTERFKFAVDFNAYGSDLDANLNSLASAYVTALHHLHTHFDGEQLKGYVKELESMVSEIKYTMANYFAGSVGGFLDKNGFSQETEKIYKTILSEYDKKMEQYSNFLKADSDYLGLKGTEDEWLLNDVAYMAHQLQKVCSTEGEKKASAGSVYSLVEISLANRLIRETESTSFFHSLGNEESIGLEVGILLLKTDMFAGNSGVTDGFAGKVFSAVRNYIDREIDRENARIESTYSKPYYPADIEERNPVYDKSAIYAVSEKMLSVYEAKRDYQEAVLEGIQFALNTSSSKEDESGKIDRYKDNQYWARFFDNSSQFASRYYMNIKGYDKRTEFQKLADSWNDFVSDLSESEDYQLRMNNFSVLA